MAQVLAEDERTQRTANALELIRDGVANGVEDTVDGVIIKQDFDHLIMEENEVDKYTPLQSATMQ